MKEAKASQQERMQILAAVIMENKNGKGASTEKVISLAASKGIEREQVLKDIQLMKERDFKPYDIKCLKYYA